MKFKLYSNWLAAIGWLAVGWLAAGWLTAGLVQAEDSVPAVARPIDFERDVRPLLSQHCGACHSQEKQESGLRLDHREAAMLGGDSGKAILPGDGYNSRLIAYVSGREPDHLMPPEGPPLSPAQVRILQQWIDEGANWPVESKSTPATNSHWAYQPIRELIPPAAVELSAAHSPSAVRNEIDQFIVAKLGELGLTPAPEADRATLIRRLSLDLRGLLPSLEEIDAFVRDSNPTAYEDLVDRLLNSPHFGERWGRHWLDMARYADSDGYEKDNPRPDAYRYRDWVIDAINADMPFDQFTIEQLAGDLLPNASDMQRLATAFHRQTLTNTEGGTDQEQFRVEACFDRTETTGAIWLGLTVGCARCHSHKYEAISQREYYQLFSFFNNADEQTHVVPKSLSEIRSYEIAQAAHTAKLAPLRAALAAAQAELKPDLEIWEATLKARLNELAEHPVKALCVHTDSDNQ
jgi:mono/diheme cytochrome c family protein